MSDQYTPLPVKTKTAGDIVANINNGTVTSVGTNVGVGTVSNLGSMTNAGTIKEVTTIPTVTTVSNLTNGSVAVTAGTVGGKAASGAAAVANPVLIAGTDSGGTVYAPLVDTTGALKVTGASAGTTVTVDHGTITVSNPGGAPTSPQFSYQTSSALAAGALATLSFTAITNGKTGQLNKVIVSSSVPIRAEIQRLDDAGTGVGTAGVVFTSSAYPTTWWEAPYKSYFTRSSTGTAKFRTVITNEDNALAADVYATGFWDEV